MTHADLVARAARWLHNTLHHPIVLVEIGSTGGESPDVIGWKTGHSTLIECKASRSDFLADRKKPFRLMPDLGMGRLRWYCAPPGVIAPADLPERWGLVEAHGRSMRVVAKAGPYYEALSFVAQVSETHLLMSAAQRIAEGWGRAQVAYPRVPEAGPPPPRCRACFAEGRPARGPACHACGRALRLEPDDEVSGFGGEGPLQVRH